MSVLADANLLMLSLLLGGVGTVLFLYGKKETRLPHMLVGGLFCIYPYFVPSAWGMAIVGILLSAALWFVVRLGW